MFDWLRKRFGKDRDDAAIKNGSLGLQLILYLTDQISVPEKATSVREKVDQFKKMSLVAQYDALPAMYLLLEQYLAEVDPRHKYTRDELREFVRLQYKSLLSSDPFALIFVEDNVRQELLLCRDFILAYLHLGYDLMGAQLDEAIYWLAQIPENPSLPIPLAEQTELPSTDAAWVPFLRQFSQAYVSILAEALGEDTAVRIVEKGYDGLAQMYIGLETFPIIIRLLPENLLDEHKISLLSSRQIQRTLIKNVADLEKINDTVVRKNAELERTQSALIAAREEALRSSSQFQAVINTVGDGIVAFTHLGDIVLANKEAQSMWDVHENQLVGEHILTLLPDLYLENWDEFLLNTHPAVERHDVTQVLGQWLEMESHRANGTPFSIEVKVNVTQIGERVLYTAAVRDITERKRFELAMAHARDWALEASDLKSRLLVNMGHDLRTPLNAILGYVDMLKEGVYGDISEEQVDVIRRVLRNGAQMNGLINNLLDQVRSESGQMIALNIRPFQPATLLENIHSTTELAARKKGLECTTTLDPQLPEEMIGDEDRLFQIVLNLVNNAIKFTDEGYIKIEFCAQDDTNWIISVADSGRGIAKSDQALIFEPFQQIVGTGQEGRGLGLGLSIVNQFVTLMDGEINLSSQLGKGSTIKISLPIHPKEAGHEQ
mgnify:CR=1 FL=1